MVEQSSCFQSLWEYHRITKEKVCVNQEVYKRKISNLFNIFLPLVGDVKYGIDPECLKRDIADGNISFTIVKLFAMFKLVAIPEWNQQSVANKSHKIPAFIWY